jgi:hypothetical protein
MECEIIISPFVANENVLFEILVNIFTYKLGLFIIISEWAATSIKQKNCMTESPIKAPETLSIF